MADDKFDPTTAKPVDSTPDGFDPGSAYIPTLAGEAKKGVLRGIDTMQQGGYGLIAAAANAAGAKGAEDWAREGVARNEREAQENPAAVGRLEDIGGVRDAALWATGGLAEQVAPMALSIAGAAAGAPGAGHVAKALGAAPGVIAKAAETGAVIGAGATSIGQEVGSIAADQAQDNNLQPGKALAYGIPAGLLDVIPESRLIRRLTGHGKAMGAARDIATQAGLESVTEGAQTALERKGNDKEVLSKEGISEMLNAAALGGLGGGVMRTITRPFDGAAAPAEPQPKPEPVIAGLLPAPGQIPIQAGQGEFRTAEQIQAELEADRNASDIYAARDAFEASRRPPPPPPNAGLLPPPGGTVIPVPPGGPAGPNLEAEAADINAGAIQAGRDAYEREQAALRAAAAPGAPPLALPAPGTPLGNTVLPNDAGPFSVTQQHIANDAQDHANAVEAAREAEIARLEASGPIGRAAAASMRTGAAAMAGAQRAEEAAGPAASPLALPEPLTEKAKRAQERVSKFAADLPAVTLAQAQAVAQAATDRYGEPVVVIPHPSGRGFTAIPEKVVPEDIRQQFGGIQREGGLPSPQTPTSEMVASPAGEVRQQTADERQVGMRAAVADWRRDMGTPTPKGAEPTGAAPPPIPPQLPIKKREAAVARAEKLTAETGREHEVVPHPFMRSAFAVRPVAADVSTNRENANTSEESVQETDTFTGGEQAPSVNTPPADDLDTRAHEAATSPQNDLAHPTAAQAEAGNYRKGHVKIHGLDVSIENPRESVRVAKDGSWASTMPHHYGYIRRSEGADGDHVDTFIGPNQDSERVYVVNQLDPKTGKFDEHKVMLGFSTREAAEAGYRAAYPKDWSGMGSVVETDVAGLKAWLKDGDTKSEFRSQDETDRSQGGNARGVKEANAFTHAPNVLVHVNASPETGVGALPPSSIVKKVMSDPPLEVVDLFEGRRVPSHLVKTVLSIVGEAVRLGVPTPALDGITSFYVKRKDTGAEYALSPQAIGISLDTLEAQYRGSRAWASTNVGNVIHEVGHHITGEPDGTSYVEESPAFEVRFDASGRRVAVGEVMLEALAAHARGGDIGTFLNYPLAEWQTNTPAFPVRGGMKPIETSLILKEEVFAQTWALYFTNPQLLQSEMPRTFDLMEEVAHGIRDRAGIADARRAVRATLRARGAAPRVVAEDRGRGGRAAQEGARGREAGARLESGRGVLAEGQPQDAVGTGGGQRDAGLEAAPGSRGSEGQAQRLTGAPDAPYGPSARAQQVARDYMREAGLEYNPPTDYVKVDPERGKRIADAYAAMKHEPGNPRVKRAYRAMIDETIAQWKAIEKSGLKVTFGSAERPYPYTIPQEVFEDVEKNNHMWVYPTIEGFGSDASFDASDNPLLEMTGIKFGDYEATANDIFRIVHDYFGHLAPGVGFRANGEENAWRHHASMFSPLARAAMTSETRGQNSWLNWGPHGEKNRTAKTEDTVFADQKTGLLPDWVIEDNYAKRGEKLDVKTPIVYRGEHGERAPGDKSKVQTRLGSISFVNNRSTADLYARQPNDLVRDLEAKSPRVIKARLNIDKPVMDRKDDPFIGLDDIIKAVGIKEAKRIALKFSDAIEGTNNWDEQFSGEYDSVADLVEKAPSRLGELYFDAYRYLDDADEVALLRRRGYDGAIHAGNGASATDVEYKVFSEGQVELAADRRGLVAAQKAKGAPGSDVGHRRESSGRYVGAPDWVGGSPMRLAHLRRKLKQLATEGEVGRYWYENSSKSILSFMGGDKKDAEDFVSLIAIYSPNNAVPGNTTAALLAWYQRKAGVPIRVAMASADKKANDLLYKGAVWSGVKTNSFYQNLMVEIDPSKLDPGVATMDMWMAIAFDYGDKSVDQGPKYRFMEAEIQRLAGELGWAPHQVQAAIWTAMKGRIDPIRDQLKERELKVGIGEMYDDEGKQKYRVKKGREYDHFRLAHKLGMGWRPELEHFKKASYDFADALRDRSAQMSWEARPSADVSKFPELFTAPIEQQAEYMAAIDAALRGENGRDLVAEKLGIPMAPTEIGPGAWAGDVGIAGQTQTGVAFEAGKTGDKRTLDARARSALNVWAAIRGLVLKQDGVYWHYPVFEVAKKHQNGLQIMFQRPLSVDDTRALYKAISDEAGHTEWAPAVRGAEVRILNFDGDNARFHATIDRALRYVRGDAFDGYEVRGFRSDGDAITNDWKENPNGEGYVERIGAEGRSDVLGWATTTLADAVKRVDEAFAAKYGWTLGTEEAGAAEGEVRRPGALEVRQEDMSPSTQEVEPEPLWYSRLNAGLEKAPWSKAGDMPVGQLKMWIAARTKDGTLPSEEVKWSGLDDYVNMFASPGLKVTRDQVESYLKQNGVRVEEVELGGRPAWRRRLDMLETRGVSNLSNEEYRELTELREKRDDDDAGGVEDDDVSSAKFADYQLPGGENYRELLLTLPPKRFWLDGSPVNELDPEERRAADRIQTERDTFLSSHFYQRNILAHVRFNERKDADGKRILFLEEIQSDWAQEGRKEGFDADKFSGWKFTEAPGIGWFASGPDPIQQFGPFKTEADARSDMERRQILKGAVPTAPFVTKTEAWVALALKRMLRYAADNGFDGIAWTTGEQQADRYDLSEKISKIAWSAGETKTKGFRVGISAYYPEGGLVEQISDKLYGPKEVDGVIGKELGDRIRKSIDDGVLEGEFSGLDLKIGGEGMRAFYDRIVPNVANDLLKKIGGGRVGMIELGRNDALDPYEDPHARISDDGMTDLGGLLQPGFYLTDDIKPKARRPQALFAKTEFADVTQTTEFKAWFGNSKVVDEGGKPLVVYHGTDATFTTFNTRQNEDGAFFTTNKEAAEDYGDRVIPVYLQISNPLEVTPREWATGDVLTLPQAVRDGYDGYIIRGHDVGGDPSPDSIHTTVGDTYIAFRPEQIKSAIGNNGNFDPKRPSILEARSELAERATEYVGDLLHTQRSFNLWDRTVGTPLHKAWKDEDFRPVYDGVQAYLNDASFLMTKAADLAPDVLPKLEGLRGILGATASKADIESMSSAIFDGTLDDRVYTDTELSGRGLTPKAIELYRQTRAAIDRSLTDLFVSEAVKQAKGLLPADVLSRARETSDPWVIVDGLSSIPVDRRTPVQQQVYDQLRERAARIEELKQQGYAPLMRFGRYTVHLADANGGSLSFTMHESEREANAVARAMREAYPQHTVTQGVLSEDAWQLFQGVTPDTLEIFAESLGASDRQLFQKYLKLATNNRSTLKRLIQRKKIPGFSPDAQRALAQFVTSNGRAASRNYHWGDVLKAANAVPKEKGDVKDEAVRLAQYVQHPTEEAGALRGLLFVQFLGGSVASALTNATQPILMSFPYLSRFGAGKAAAELIRAAKVAVGGQPAEADLRAAMNRAAHEGIIAPHEVAGLYAESIRNLGSNLVVRRILRAWGSLFSLAEAFNRRITFAAAFRLARDAGEADPYGFAVQAIAETQGVYNRGNRPNWARGAVGATLFTFKQYSIAYVEFLRRLPAKERAIALAVLVLAAGMQGLPGADDLEDVIDTIAESLGYSWNSKKAAREWAIRTLGESAGGILAGGFSGLPGVPIDVQARLGLGNLIPGTGVLKRSNPDKSRDVLEFFGPAGSQVKAAADAIGAAQEGNYGQIAKSMVPLALQNAMKAADMASTGFYHDSRGRRVIDVDTYDAMIKGIGIQPKRVAEVQRRRQDLQQDIALQKDVESEISDLWARGIYEKDPEKVARARAKLLDWNLTNPESRIVVSPQQIQRRVQQAMMTADQRFIKTAPPELRARIAGDLLR